MEKKKINKTLLLLSFVIYMILLCWIIVFKWTNYVAVYESIYTFRHLDLLTRFNRICEGFFHLDCTDLILNMLLFLPLGVLYFLIFKRKSIVILFGVLLTIIFEITQFFTCIGMFNIYDLLGNILGIGIGYSLYFMFKKFYTAKLINFVNLMIVVCFSPVTIYAIYMTIKNINVYL